MSAKHQVETENSKLIFIENMTKHKSSWNCAGDFSIVEDLEV